MPEPLLAQLIETLNNAQIKRSWGLSLERRKVCGMQQPAPCGA